MNIILKTCQDYSTVMSKVCTDDFQYWNAIHTIWVRGNYCYYMNRLQ